MRHLLLRGFAWQSALSLDTAREKIAPTRDERKSVLKSTHPPFVPRVAAFSWRRIEWHALNWRAKPLRSDDKKCARLNAIHHVLSLIPYKNVPRETIKLPKRSMKGAYHDRASLKGRKFVPEKY